MNNSTPLISVIVPVYKAEKHLDRCVKTIVNQTYRNLEIILVDDGSPDKSGELCEAWAVKDSRIKVIHKKNGGISSARNAALAIRTGKWIAFVDDDDTIPETAYESLIAAALSYQNVGMVMGNFYTLDESMNGELTANESFIIKERKVVDSEFVFERFFYHTYSPEPWYKIYSDETIGETLFPTGLMAEDDYFNGKVSINMREKGLNLVEIPDFVYVWHYSGNNSSTTHAAKMWLDLKKNRLSIATQFYNKFPAAESTQGMLKFAWRSVLYATAIFAEKNSMWYKRTDLQKDWEEYINTLTWDNLYMLKPCSISFKWLFALQKHCSAFNPILRKLILILFSITNKHL